MIPAPPVRRASPVPSSHPQPANASVALNRQTGLALACVLAGFAGFAIGALDCLNFTVDDSFISLRFAENWANGSGLVFNPGERVEGYSNFLWTLVLGVLAKAGIQQQAGPFALLIATKLLGCAF